MFALVGQVERELRGREAFQEIDQAATIGGLAAHAAELDEPRPSCRRPSATPSARRSVGRPGPGLLSVPEDLLDEELPAGTTLGHRRGRRRRARSPTTSARRSSSSPARKRPVILAGGGVLRARTSTDLAPARRAARASRSSPAGAAATSSRTTTRSTSAWPATAARRSSASGSTRRTRCSSSAAGCRRSPRSATRSRPTGQALDARRRRAARSAAGPAGRRAARSAPTPGPSCARPSRGSRQGVLDAAGADARQAANDDRSGRLGGGDRGRRRRHWAGPGVHPGHVDRDRSAGSCPTTRSSPPTPATSGCGSPATSGSAGRARSSARPPGAMGYALPAAIAAGLVHRDRAVVAFAGDGGFAMTMAELETAVREKAKVIAIVFDNERYGTIRMHQDRRGAGTTGRSRPTSGRSTSPRSPGPAAAAGSGSRPTPRSSRPSARRWPTTGRPSSRSPLDRGWVHPDQPFAGGAFDAAGVTPTFHLTPAELVGRRRSGGAAPVAVPRRRGVHPLHDRGRRAGRDGEPPLPRRPAAVRPS